MAHTALLCLVDEVIGNEQFAIGHLHVHWAHAFFDSFIDARFDPIIRRDAVLGHPLVMQLFHRHAVAIGYIAHDLVYAIVAGGL